MQKLNLKPSEIKEEEKVKATEISAEQKELDEQKLSELLKNENLNCLYRDNILQIYEKISDNKCVIYTTENREYISTLMAGDVEKYTFGAKPLYKLCFAEN